MNGNDMAFPVEDRMLTPNDSIQLGLTKRELFAAMAMQGFCAREVQESVTSNAIRAVNQADELLAVLSRSQNVEGEKR